MHVVSFDFATAGKITFGCGAFAGVGKLAASYGRRALIVTGSRSSSAERLIGLLSENGVSSIVFNVPGEPTIALAQAGIAAARSAECDVVIGIGGGSAIDAGKAIAILLTHPGEPLDYLEVIGRGQSLSRPSLPYIAIPTTAGTGAEVTMNAVLASPEHRVKVSLRSPHMLPRAAVVDPDLTLTLPPAITAQTGMDALTQNIEPFVSNKASPLTDAIAREGIRRAARSLRTAYADGANVSARVDMALASLCGGLALANAKLGAVHGFASPIGGMFPAPHGAVCAVLLPPVMDVNLRALRSRTPDSPVLDKYAEVARLLTGRPDATPEDAVAWTRETAALLGIPPLSAYGVTSADLNDIVEKAAAASSMQGNPIKLSHEELYAVLASAL